MSLLDLQERRSATTYHFDPREHPRNRVGQFVDVLKKLRTDPKGSEVWLPGDRRVFVKYGRYHVTAGGKKVRNTLDPHDAAAAALGRDAVDSSRRLSRKTPVLTMRPRVTTLEDLD